MAIKYYGGLKGPIIWTTHILMGIFFAYIGYLLMNNKPVPKPMAIVVLSLGLLAVVYHAYLWSFGYK